MKMIKYFENEINNMSGNVLGLGLEDNEIIERILKNQNITTFNLLDSFSKKNDTENINKQKKIKNLRKYFKKKRINTIIFNIDNIKESKTKLIYDTLYIGKNNIYIYSSNTEIDEFINKYKRYTKKIEKTICKDKTVYKIIIEGVRNNIIKEKIYKLFDSIINTINIISDTLSE